MQKLLDFDQRGVNYTVYRFNGTEFSTVKDVGAYEIVSQAASNGSNVLVNITSGNYGTALRDATFEWNKTKTLEDKVKVVHIIDPSNNPLAQGLTGIDNEFFFEFSIPYRFNEIARRWMSSGERIDAAKTYLLTNDPKFKIKEIVDVTHIIPNEYIRQAEEVLSYGHLDYLVVPVGTGRTFLAFYHALQNLKESGVETLLVGIVPRGQNPIYHRFVFERRNTDGLLEYLIEGYKPGSRADKLSCPATDLLDELKKAIVDGHVFLEIGNKEITRANQAAYGITVDNKRLALEDSASVGFAILTSRLVNLTGIEKGNNVGIFVTGRGLYATPTWEEKEMAWQRRKSKFYNTALNLGVAASFIGLLSIPILSPQTERQQELTKLYEQKVEILNQSKTDPLLGIAVQDVENKYGVISMTRIESLKYPDPIVDEIIEKYLDLNKDKINGARDPRDIGKFTTLRYLVLRSEQLEPPMHPATK